MKPFLLIILVLILALALLASCMYTNLSGSASQNSAVVTNTVPAGTETSGPPPTVDTLSPLIFSDFNMAIESMETSEQFNELEHIAGASYQVIGVDLPQENSPVFRVKTRCECVENGPCCNYSHTFIITIMVLGKIYHNPSFQSLPTPAPGKVSLLEVWCYDHASLNKVMTVPWADVISFLDNNINGFQLWAKVTPQP